MLLTAAFILFVYVFLLWLLSLAAKDASIIDRFWGIGFILVCMAGLRWFEPVTPHKVFVSALVFLWGARLSVYITWRGWEQGEDYRYQAMRAKHGRSFSWKSLFTVFLLQGFLTWFISMPLQVAFVASEKVSVESPWVVAGTVLFFIGFFFEAVGDWQLARFKASPENRGRVMDQGLWRFTRHPNYFGDAVLWWGIFLTALPAPQAAFTVLSPVVMTALLMKVSGVPLLEKRMAETRPEYAEYVQRTPAFFPWRPRG